MNLFENKEKMIKLGLIAAIIALCCVSFFWAGNKFTKVETFEDVISILDDKKSTVLGLTAASSSASVAITVLPDDIGTPIADELADITSYLLIALTVIYLEKYLLTIMGFAVFKILIPLGLGMLLVYVLYPENISFKKVGFKLVAFATVLMCVVPCSSWITHQIDTTYQSSISETFSNATKEEEVIIEQEEEKVEEALPWYQKALQMITNSVEAVKDTVTSNATEAIEKSKTMLSRFVEATAVMVVTSCVIPILTLFVFIWLSKIILQLDINLPEPKRLKNGLKGALLK